jgi:hypothetical protein
MPLPTGAESAIDASSSCYYTLHIYLVNLLHLRSFPNTDVSPHNKQLSLFRDCELSFLFQCRLSNVAVHKREKLLDVKLIREGLSIVY